MPLGIKQSIYCIPEKNHPPNQHCHELYSPEIFDLKKHWEMCSRFWIHEICPRNLGKRMQKKKKKVDINYTINMKALV